MGRLAPDLADAIFGVVDEKTLKQTKENYVSLFRHWFNWCLDFDINPLGMPLDRNVVMFWMQERVNMSGSVASYSSWKSMLLWITTLTGSTREWADHPEFKSYVYALKKKYHLGVDHRLPFTVRHLELYTNKVWFADPNNTRTVPYDDVMKVLLANLYYLTMSRPSEMLKTTRKNVKRSGGLTFADIHDRYDYEHGISITEIDISNYKNAASRKIIKKIYLADNNCKQGDKCRTYLMNPFILLKFMIRRRRKLVQDLIKKLQKMTTVNKEYKALRKRIDNLLIRPDQPLFVWENGLEVLTRDLNTIAKEIAEKNQIFDKHHYAAYSLRIGGTTTASLAGIEHPLILKYVGWSSSRLASCAQRYMRYSPFELCQVPFLMLHGVDENALKRTRTIAKSQIYDPWSEKLNNKYIKDQ